MKFRNFVMCTAILMMIYLCGTLSYFSQIYILNRYYESNLLTSFISGWNYLSQATGMITFMILYQYKKEYIQRKGFIYICLLLTIPILGFSVGTGNGSLRISMVFLNNMLIGFNTSYGFSLLARCISHKLYGRSFALAYAVGGVGTWVISKIDGDLISTHYVLLPCAVMIVITCGLIFSFNNYHDDFGESSETMQLSLNSGIMLSLIIILMALITAFGSNDPVLAQSANQLDFLTTRFYYAGGLLIAGLIFDFNPIVGGICSVGALIYPLMVIVLYHELPGNMAVIGLTDTFTGFFAVWRAGSFMRLSFGKSSNESCASLGLCISRIVEGSMVLLLCLFHPGRLMSFVITGILFMMLVVVFCLFMQEWIQYRMKKSVITENVDESSFHNEKKEESMETLPISKENRRVTFAEKYGLTRREEEIAGYLADNKTNGEIATELNLSESTVRFHVSNILKKTGMKNRNEVARSFWL